MEDEEKASEWSHSSSAMSSARAAEGQNKEADDIWWHPSVFALHRVYPLVVGARGVMTLQIEHKSQETRCWCQITYLPSLIILSVFIPFDKFPNLSASVPLPMRIIIIIPSHRVVVRIKWDTFSKVLCLTYGKPLSNIWCYYCVIIFSLTL